MAAALDLLLLAIVASASAASISQCPGHLPDDGYLTAHGDYCYRFHMWQRKEYYHADKTCDREGGILATPKTYDQMSNIKSELKYTFNYRSDPVWIGLGDYMYEYDFEWEDGKLLQDDEFSYWGDNQGPNNKDFVSSEMENCVAINPRDNYKWHDFQCKDFLVVSHSYAFICQFDKVQTTQDPATDTPSDAPTDVPTHARTDVPSDAPAVYPTDAPTHAPIKA